jgi:ABC-type long-subunit fatty acid transport system fused permease/ATPase subunit
MSTVLAFIAVLVSGVVDLSSFIKMLPSLFMIRTVPAALVIAAPVSQYQGAALMQAAL